MTVNVVNRKDIAIVLLSTESYQLAYVMDLCLCGLNSYESIRSKNIISFVPY